MIRVSTNYYMEHIMTIPAIVDQLIRELGAPSCGTQAWDHDSALLDTEAAARRLSQMGDGTLLAITDSMRSMSAWGSIQQRVLRWVRARSPGALPCGVRPRDY
jgi:hypothetical protein